MTWQAPTPRARGIMDQHSTATPSESVALTLSWMAMRMACWVRWASMDIFSQFTLAA